MTIRKILTEPDPILKKISSPVDEVGMILLRLVEIIGEDDLENLDSDSLYFIITILNQLNLDTIRDRLLLKVLPLKI